MQLPFLSGDLTIREATHADAARLALLIGQLGYAEEEADVAARLAALDPRQARVLVAEMDGAVIGCLSTSFMTVLHRPRPVGRISMMVVAEGARGRKVGARLVRAAEALLADLGCGLVEVTSNESRLDAHRFYLGLGYERTSLRFARQVGG